MPFSSSDSGLTMLEVELNIVASNVGSHSNDRSAVKLANKMACRYTIQIWHYDIHQN
jgi:tetrahydromethanopterin S-methyltransferase subunit E